MRSLIIRDSLFVTLVVSIVILMAAMLGDGVSAPIQAVLGADGKEIHDSQTMVFFGNNVGLVVLMILGTFFSSIWMLTYLRHGE